MKEIWKPVVDWPYEVSNLGRVRSVRGLLKPQIDYRGYRYVELHNAPRKKRRVKVGRLVLESFIGPANGLEVDHDNRIRSDDRLSNLKWNTRRGNVRNRGPFLKSSSGGIPGVSWYKKSSRWRAFKKINGKLFHVGYFLTIEEASDAVRRFK